jgi:hypothetical protein
MQALTLDLFTHAERDMESAQYRILAALKHVEKAFHNNRLYPGLADVLEIGMMLDTIRQNAEQVRDHRGRRLSGVDIESKTLVFEQSPTAAHDAERTIDLVQWALPRLKTLADEGMAMFDFVSHSIHIDAIGILPMYRDEGYLLVPEEAAGLVHVFRYELSIYTSQVDHYRTMKTVELPSRPLAVIAEAPENVKLELLATYADLPNPATYRVETDVPFPFDATVLPVAKRKLMRYLIS